MGIYQINIEDAQQNVVSLDKFRGKVLLIVNTALHCGFSYQYEGLQLLEDEFHQQGFAVLDFPCNQFANQTPEDDHEINEVCATRYKTTFFRGRKIEVNGLDESILYTFLKYHKKGLFSRKIKWNFTKFLVSKEGYVLKRYAPNVKPARIRKDIMKALQAK